jgi:hypothetical protein
VICSTACACCDAVPGFTAVVLTILSVAIGASVTVFSIVDAWLLRPLRFPMPIASSSASPRSAIGLMNRRSFLFYRSYLGFKAESQSLASVSAAFRRSYLVTGRGDASSVVGMAVSEEFFRHHGRRPGHRADTRFRGRGPCAGDGAQLWILATAVRGRP